MIWKDRVKQYPHRYKLTQVSESIYDFEEVTGEVTEAGTPVNAENLNKLIQRDDISTVMPISSAAASNEKVLSEKVVYDEFAKKQDLKYGYIVDSRTNCSIYWGKVAEIDVSSMGVGDVNLDFLVTTNHYNKNQMGILRFGVRKGSGVSIIGTNHVDLNWLIKSATLSESKYVAVIQGLKVSLYARPSNQYGGTRFELLQATTASGVHTSGYYTLYEVTNPTDTELPTNDGIVTSSVLGTTAPTPTTDNSTVPKSYVDAAISSLAVVYDLVIKTQAEFDALIDSETWLGATSVALVGQFTVSRASGIKVPDTVRQIHGFNNAKITVTGFQFNSTDAKAALWYSDSPTEPGYSIRDLEVECIGTGPIAFVNCNGLYNCAAAVSGSGGMAFSDCTGLYECVVKPSSTDELPRRGFGYCTNLTNCTGKGTGTGTGTGSYGEGFYNCTNLTNCTGTGTGTGTGRGFYNCTNLTNCTGTGTGTGTGTFGIGFYYCENLTNCTGTGTGTGTGTFGYGFSVCTNLTNCTGTGTGTTEGFGFYGITTASNCRDGNSSTAMWGGTNYGIDESSCKKTKAEANIDTLNA